MTILIRLHPTCSKKGGRQNPSVAVLNGPLMATESSQRSCEQSYSNVWPMLDRYVAGSAQDIRQGHFTSTDLPVLALECIGPG